MVLPVMEQSGLMAMASWDTCEQQYCLPSGPLWIPLSPSWHALVDSDELIVEAIDKQICRKVHDV